MKRSEMVDLIHDCLWDSFRTGSWADASDILDIIEKKGMLPPKAWVVTNPNNPLFPELAHVKEHVNDWEPED